MITNLLKVYTVLSQRNKSLNLMFKFRFAIFGKQCVKMYVSCTRNKSVNGRTTLVAPEPKGLLIAWNLYPSSSDSFPVLQWRKNVVIIYTTIQGTFLNNKSLNLCKNVIFSIQIKCEFSQSSDCRNDKLIPYSGASLAWFLFIRVILLVFYSFKWCNFVRTFPPSLAKTIL